MKTVNTENLAESLQTCLINNIYYIIAILEQRTYKCNNIYIASNTIKSKKTIRKLHILKQV